MPSYWWQCQACNEARSFVEVTASKGITHFIWDELLPSDWDQKHLTRICPKCNDNSLRITYEFPRQDKVTLFVHNIVGITDDNYFMPMLWCTSPSEDKGARWYDFKYVNGRNIFGLNKAVVFTQGSLTKILELFNNKCHRLV